MTSIHQALRHQLQSLQQLLRKLNNEAYCFNSRWLSNATIGQHSRHVIELLQCLVNGYTTGLVNYDKRERDRSIETDRNYAISVIEMLLLNINRENKKMILIAAFSDEDKAAVSEVESTYEREIVYNIEHAVHHMALIKVGLKELNIELEDEGFGVAYATIQHRKLCAQ